MKYYFYSMQHYACAMFSNDVYKGNVDTLYKKVIKDGMIIFFKEITEREYKSIKKMDD